MPYIGGTPEVQNFIKKYKASGYLIDPYSNEWISSVVERVENDEINHESSLYTYESFDEDYGTSYRNHLLIVYVNMYNKELIEDLKHVYQPLKYILEEQGSTFGTYKPDFLFINLATQQILCVGLGRKNRLMQFDANKYATGKHEPEIDMLEKNPIASVDIAYFAKFTALDYDGLCEKLIFDLKTLGESLVDYECLNYHPEMTCELNSDGIYEFDNGRDSVGEDELEALNESFQIISTAIEESTEGLQVFFPFIDIADLNNLD